MRNAVSEEYKKPDLHSKILQSKLAPRDIKRIEKQKKEK